MGVAGGSASRLAGGEYRPYHWEQFDEEIKQGVEALAPEYRIVLLLWALEQLNDQEIAHVCNIPVGTVMSRLFRARKDLAENWPNMENHII